MHFYNLCAGTDKKIDWDNWENKRGPRPWEDNQEPDREIKVRLPPPLTNNKIIIYFKNVSACCEETGYGS